MTAGQGTTLDGDAFFLYRVDRKVREMPVMTTPRRTGISLLGIVVLLLEVIAVFFMELLNSLGSAFEQETHAPWVESLVFWLSCGLVGQAAALCVLVANGSRTSLRFWLGLWAVNLAGVWAAFAGPLDDLPVPILLTCISAPVLWWQVRLLQAHRNDPRTARAVAMEVSID